MRVDIKKCQRCGKNHDALVFWELTNPADNYKYWALCPATDEPVMLAVFPDRPDQPIPQAWTPSLFEWIGLKVTSISTSIFGKHEQS